MIGPYWTVCTHCRRVQKTLAKKEGTKRCVYCGKTFKVSRANYVAFGTGAEKTGEFQPIGHGV